MNAIEIKGITLYRTNNDVYGNPRYIVHFYDFLTDDEHDSRMDVMDKYNIATKRAKRCGFKKYRANDFGGGFVITTYSERDTANRIIEERGVKQ